MLVGQVCTNCSAGEKEGRKEGGEEERGERMRRDKPCGRCKSCMDEMAVRGGEVSVRLRWRGEEDSGEERQDFVSLCSTNVAVSVSGFC